VARGPELAAPAELARTPGGSEATLTARSVTASRASAFTPDSHAHRASGAGHQAAWLRDFVDEVTSFPAAPHDDQVRGDDAGFELPPRALLRTLCFLPACRRASAAPVGRCSTGRIDKVYRAAARSKTRLRMRLAKGQFGSRRVQAKPPRCPGRAREAEAAEPRIDGLGRVVIVRWCRGRAIPQFGRYERASDGSDDR